MMVEHHISIVYMKDEETNQVYASIKQLQIALLSLSLSNSLLPVHWWPVVFVVVLVV